MFVTGCVCAAGAAVRHINSSQSYDNGSLSFKN